ncbi:predicted protein [Verticillium alfalfae VaMs.102]|uniref:Predicted protein n=1 Tax=Verticillium alfalfae (strain VaMs.102 / ATCC MYA-4576 / FGSC 10136) TaxID=526221 RepID=C9SBR2_VERA1|nr:predicted protein [Verticillium alfalfae VaMs.102]EEY15796.1 predicted protein [Verticillium alfalfae VaMs.102]
MPAWTDTEDPLPQRPKESDSRRGTGNGGKGTRSRWPKVVGMVNLTASLEAESRPQSSHPFEPPLITPHPLLPEAARPLLEPPTAPLQDARFGKGFRATPTKIRVQPAGSEGSVPVPEAGCGGRRGREVKQPSATYQRVRVLPTLEEVVGWRSCDGI